VPQISEEEKRRLEEERKEHEAAEAERKRLEEQEKALEVAREQHRKAKEELEVKVKEASDYLKGVADATIVHIENRTSLSAKELASARKAFEASKKSLKSDLKKCTAFVKKIKAGGAWSMKPEHIVKDVSTLNLSRYVEEVVAALLESKLKRTDLPVVLALCKAMHQRYPEFMPNLLKRLWSVIQGKPTEETAKLRRIYVRLITEFLLNGILTETKTLVKLIAESTGGKDGNYVVTDATVVVAFVKAAGFEIFGVTPQSVRRYSTLVLQEAERLDQHQKSLPEKPASDADADVDVVDASPGGDDAIVVSSALANEAKTNSEKVTELLSERAVSPELSELFLSHCKGAYRTLSNSLVSTHGRLQKMEKRCEQDRLLSGSLTEGREKGLNDARKLRDSLQKSVEALSDALNLHMPQLKEEENEEADGGGVGVELWMKGGDEEGASFGPFDDEETRAFYCDIPDLLTTVPPALLGMGQDEIDKRKADNLAKFGSGFDNESDEADGETAEVAPSSEEQLEAAEQEESNPTAESQEGKHPCSVFGKAFLLLT
jgi:regulator of nonsense transcripts 2